MERWISTRSDASEDAHRDFDGFDVDEELRRLREAVKDGGTAALTFVAEAASNIDEHLNRGGVLPKRWRTAGSVQRRHTG